MEHDIIEKEGFKVVGIPVVVSLNDPDYQEKIMDLWIEFIPRADEIDERKDARFYGLCNTSGKDKDDEYSFEYIAGVEVKKDKNIPDGMKLLDVPSEKYFMVTHRGNLNSLGKTYDAIKKEMKKLELKEGKDKISLELYDNRFKEDSEESEFDIYTPLK